MGKEVDGWIVGEPLGLADGDALGDVLGGAVGEGVGRYVGNCVGGVDGKYVGRRVGARVVGDSEGALVGELGQDPSTVVKAMVYCPAPLL